MQNGLLAGLSLGPVPCLAAVHPFDLLLQLKEPVQQGLSSGRAAGDINVHLKTQQLFIMLTTFIFLCLTGTILSHPLTTA